MSLLYTVLLSPQEQGPASDTARGLESFRAQEPDTISVRAQSGWQYLHGS